MLVCPSRSILGISCPGCGSGTALIALSELRILDAVIANPLFVIGGFALSLWGLIAAAAYFFGRPLKPWAVTKGRKSILRYGLILAILANWIYEILVM